MEKRKINIMFNKGGTGGLSPRITLPITWVRELGAGPENREVNIYSLGKMIIVSKEDIEGELKNMGVKINKLEIIEDLKKYEAASAFYADQYLKDIPDEFLEDKEFIKEAVKANPVVLRSVKDCYITKEIAEIAIEKDPHYLNLTPFKANEELGIKAVKKNPYVLETLRELRDNFYVVKAAVEKEGLSLEYASERLQANYDIVKAAVSCEGHGSAIKFASDELKANKELAIIAIKNSRGRAKNRIAKELRNDIDIIKVVEEMERERRK